MCLAVPVQVVELLDEFTAKVRLGEGESYSEASIMLLPEPPKPGDYLIVHAGFALNILDPAEAEESLKVFREYAGQSSMLEDPDVLLDEITV